ncbi:hypothetical protein AFM11_28845 [Mycolicibacterium wolinskyi]|uniref:Uncharacterized protein n=1 Tax=Mycolicibacterium wolinskyi TaxID=59750 RepID=A0A132PES3_9MYCO|nr:hypothetical protein AFM11_28845 [Mycolicibacterium wolinskyi]
MAVDDPGVDEIVQMADEHAFGDLGDAAPQLGGAHRPVDQAPQDGAFPAAVDDRQRGVDRTFADFFLRHRHGVAPHVGAD